MATETFENVQPENPQPTFVPEMEHQLKIKVPLSSLEVMERVRIALYKMFPQHGMPSNSLVFIWLLHTGADILLAPESPDGGVSPSS